MNSVRQMVSDLFSITGISVESTAAWMGSWGIFLWLYTISTTVRVADEPVWRKMAHVLWHGRADSVYVFESSACPSEPVYAHNGAGR